VAKRVTPQSKDLGHQPKWGTYYKSIPKCENPFFSLKAYQEDKFNKYFHKGIMLISNPSSISVCCLSAVVMIIPFFKLNFFKAIINPLISLSRFLKEVVCVT